LCGALLAAHLLRKVANSLHFNKDIFYAWSDTSIVLSWIKAHSSRWETFIGNRVVAIQDLIPTKRWSYMTTNYNSRNFATGMSEEYQSTSSGKIRCEGKNRHGWELPVKTGPLKIRFIRTS